MEYWNAGQVTLVDMKSVARSYLGIQRAQVLERRLARKHWDKPIVERHLLAGESALGMGQEDSSKAPRIGLELPCKMNRSPDGRFAAAVMEVIGPEAAVVFVAPVDQNVPSSRYSPTCPSHHEGVHSQNTRIREKMADIGFAGHNQHAFATYLT
jgi:hypothetical protein